MKIVNPLSIKPQLQNIGTLLSRNWGKASLILVSVEIAIALSLLYFFDFAVSHLTDSLIVISVVHDAMIGFFIASTLIVCGYTAYWATFAENNLKINKTDSRLAYNKKIKNIMFRVGLCCFIGSFLLDVASGFSDYSSSAMTDVPSNGVLYNLSILLGCFVVGYLMIKWITVSMILYVLHPKTYASKVSIALGFKFYANLGRHSKSDLRIGMLLFGLVNYLLSRYTNVTELVLIPFMFVWCLSVIIPACCGSLPTTQTNN